jgi:hypothetical protein
LPRSPRGPPSRSTSRRASSHRALGQLADLLGAGEAELRFAGLARAENLAGAAQAKVLLGDAEAVIGLAHQSEPRARRLAQDIAAQQQADAVLVSAPDPAAQLVELGETKAVGMFDDHQGGIGTSTPTSITVVATRTAIRPVAKASITASFSGPFIRPWTTPTLSPKRSCRRRARSSAAARSEASLSSTNGQTQ